MLGGRAIKLPRLDWRVVGAALACAGILHVCTALVAASLVTDTAYKRLGKGLPVNEVRILAPITPDNQPLPFMAPDARYGICRYDTKKGPVHLTATLPEPGWAIALYDEDGVNYFTAVAGVDRARQIDVLLIPHVTGGLVQPNRTAETGAVSRSQLRIHAARGLALIRAPDNGTSFQTKNKALLKLARCRRVK